MIELDKVYNLYEEGLSTYEVLTKVVHYLNKLIDDRNKTHSELYDIIHWFETLDVQANIDKKLNSMFDEGTLMQDINNKLDENKSEIQILRTNLNGVMTQLVKLEQDVNRLLEQAN